MTTRRYMMFAGLAGFASIVYVVAAQDSERSSQRQLRICKRACRETLRDRRPDWTPRERREWCEEECDDVVSSD